MPQVYNKRTPHVMHNAVYVGRPTKWGNPYRIGKDGTREQIIAKYRAWLPMSGLDVRELKGKCLVCWCYPLPCHADVLLELANALEQGAQQ